MTDLIQGLPERLSKRMKFFIFIGEYSDEIEFMTDAVRRLIETKEKATDQWTINFEELITDTQKTDKSDKEILLQAEKVRKDIWRKKYAGSAGQ
ncbi:MAG: hypothetical protein MPEBLZ_03036 [Candidatus Methanoperedens nitroreducens]|uniref:Uncharacterized protein n=1 Tax=Candidatus Methanoperedens nitratireducens TaxID=1392998 RepID=A0A0P7ZCL4_9EURY|nr:hypothetical protein [Candidatus Methanoperedens sp. BLZ2]KAB2944579.1 MAG: hypothetical protein F9K14_13900 [Candidatus Methanoperedens sp.]KPQ42407.1 MAG: hypothetical protein MPEBLZ_03036 [Candidatus Methanoperedens sp. BLZ1]MBZ0176845.1 hypothetical protein [Candidatus Methanoperedens nitroreducens]CAG0999611.1 hypothetical protein METP2_03162 [Methanosarcinales archaeon]MCX9077078.1 hypothetical protein [Candidatus Methanoperedens sp.]